jgi:hypothetical protein
MFSSLFSRKPAAENSLPGRQDSRLSIQDTSENGLRQQLVMVTMNDLLRRSGIAPAWVSCHVQVVNSKSRGTGLYVRLVLKHWDERLMKYSFAFQKQLLTDIVRFEPKAAGWLHGITWQLEVASTCPDTVLPQKSFWVDVPPAPAREAVSPTAAALGVGAAAITPPVPLFDIASDKDKQAPEHDAKEDLERLFAIRDNELARKADDNMLPAGYESTEPSPLR